jgi:hypothetical protein
MLTLKKAIKDYNFFVELANKFYTDTNYEDCMSCINYASRLAYAVNFKYTDKNLENIIKNISENIIKSKNFKGNNNRYVFYDYFALPNRGLTQQYLRALMAWGVEFLYIIPRTIDCVDSKILDELKRYDKVQIYCVNMKAKNNIDMVMQISEALKKYQPFRAFLHMAPWDVIGNVIWNSFSNIERYQINITDHAFWLGINSSDYFLEFRNYGYNISYQYRDILKERLLLQPYYPIIDSAKYQGIPYENSVAVRLLSGGAYYKVYGENNIFFRLIKKILEENPETLFYYAGNGDERPMLKFIRANQLDDRWFLIGSRTDLSEVMKRMDIYIGTSPWSGGLMTLLAAALSIPIVAYAAISDYSNYTEGFFSSLKEVPNITIHDKDTFYATVNQLVQDKLLRKELGQKMNNSLVAVDEFNVMLKYLVDTKHNREITLDLNIDIDSVAKRYLDLDNNYLHYIPRLLINKYTLRKMPVKFIKNMFIYILHHDKISIFKSIKKLLLRK